MEIQDILKAGTVNRWNIVSTIRPQTLAEHLFNVAMIARELAKEIPSVPVTTSTYWGLMHDIEEVILGDLPTPTKKRMAAKGWNWTTIEDEVMPRSERVPDDDNLKLLIKCADRMEALWFIKTYGIGRHAELVENRMSADMSKYMQKMPKPLKDAVNRVWARMMEGEITI